MRMMVLRPLLVSLTLVPLAACATDASKPVPSTNATAKTTTGPDATATAAPKATKLKAANPKDYKKTTEQALGTLPDGIGIAVGQLAPDFVLPGKKDTKTSLDDLVKGGEALLVFYRGGW